MMPPHAPTSTMRTIRTVSNGSIDANWQRMMDSGSATESDRARIADPSTLGQLEQYSRNIETMIGTIKLPVGVLGPLRVNGLNASGDFFMPLATTEAALVASYARGAEAANKSGGIMTALLSEEMLRSPAFVFDELRSAGLFVDWIASNAERLKTVAEATTQHGKLITIEPMIDNEIVFLVCRFTTGDAAGQNMVTVAAQAICDEICANSPIPIRSCFVEGNFSGDKKSSYFGVLRGRGRKVSASVSLPSEVVRQVLRSSVDEMLTYGRVANLGALMSGQIGAQAHYANGLAAFYIATGQDAACVAESAVGFTRMEERDGALYCSVTMPNILVGAIGGGTGLPSQSAALNLIGLPDKEPGAALAELVAALCLCGEISIVAAISAGHFTDAHKSLARDR